MCVERAQSLSQKCGVLGSEVYAGTSHPSVVVMGRFAGRSQRGGRRQRLELTAASLFPSHRDLKPACLPLRGLTSGITQFSSNTNESLDTRRVAGCEQGWLQARPPADTCNRFPPGSQAAPPHRKPRLLELG